jgi:hypothetical protein
MIIGLDFDNTIVSYDALVHQVALEKGFITEEVPRNKVAVRNHLRKNGQEQEWIEMQGQIYGPRMKDAVVFEGFYDFALEAQRRQHTIYIISHKTKFPFSGPEYDLHSYATSWIDKKLTFNSMPLIPKKHIFFEVTKSEKIERLKNLGCEFFIDDLPEILKELHDSPMISKILFDPEQNHIGESNVIHLPRWDMAWKLIDENAI